MYEELEKYSLWPFRVRLCRLLVRHSGSKSEMFGLSCHVIVVNVEHHMLPQFSLSSESILLSSAHELSERRVVPDVDRQSSRHHDFTGGKEDT